MICEEQSSTKTATSSQKCDTIEEPFVQNDAGGVFLEEIFGRDTEQIDSVPTEEMQDIASTPSSTPEIKLNKRVSKPVVKEGFYNYDQIDIGYEPPAEEDDSDKDFEGSDNE